MTMIKFRKEIVQYAQELMLTFKYVDEVNAVSTGFSKNGSIRSDLSVSIYMDNGEVFSISNLDDSVKMYFNNYDTPSGTSDYIQKNECSMVKYNTNSPIINFCTDIIDMQDAFERYEEIYFQHSTLNHQCALDAFDLLLYLTYNKVQCNVLMVTPMDIRILRKFNKQFNTLLQEMYEKAGVYRV